MKAIVYTRYGSPCVLRLKEVEKPTPGDHEVLINVRAASLNGADRHYLRGAPFVFRLHCGPLKPKNTLLGADVAGLVEAVGKNVTLFQPGDAVFGDLSTCGRGTFAEYVCASEDAVALKPANTTWEAAAAVPLAAGTALRGLRNKGQIQRGHKVLINGALVVSGRLPCRLPNRSAQTSRVCSARKMDMVRSMSADHVVDYTQEDFTTHGQQYDLILVANSYHPIWAYKRALARMGRYAMTGRKTLGNMMAKPGNKDLAFMRELLEAGNVAPVIDRRYPLSKVAEAFRYFEEGHARGKVVITVAHTSN